MRVIQWGMIGFILIAAWVAERVLDAGEVSWGLGYWLIVGLALWSVSSGFRLRRRMASKIQDVMERGLAETEIRRRLNARNLLSMTIALNVAIWGQVLRFILHGTLWQAVPFYVVGLGLLVLWGPKTTAAMHSD
jgi:hypothetical protein